MKKKSDTLLFLLECNTFTRAAQYIDGRADVTYTLLKVELEQLFSGEDYRRALETKLRTLIFRRDTNIPLFCNQLPLVIGELFQITNTATVEKLALNAMSCQSWTPPSEPLKMLQLAATSKLDVLLELAKSKMVVNALVHSIFDHKYFWC